MKFLSYLAAGAVLLQVQACSPASKETSPSNGVIPVQSVSIAQVDTPPPVDSVSPEITLTVPLEALLGKIDPAKDTAFAKIEPQFSTKTDIYMRKEAYSAFKRMHAAAQADVVKLIILSATRPFSYQKNIWEAKWTGRTLVGGKNLAATIPDPAKRALKILEYSSMPTTSRHHWGTDIDLNNLENSYFASGEGKKIHDWLNSNGAKFGFCQTYTSIGAERPHGYQEEKWHWSYMPIASIFLKAYQAQVQYSDIQGFLGSDVAAELQVIDRYVGGIGPSCKAW